MKKIFTSIVLMLLTVAYAMADTSVWTMNTTAGIAEVTVVKQGTPDTGGDLELTKDGFTVTSSTGYFNGSGSNGIQIYAGGAMTITAPENCVITSIVLQYPSKCYPFSEAYPEGGAADKKTEAQTDVTFTPATAAEAFTFTNAAGGQTKVKKLTITYEEVQASTEISELVAGGKTTVNLDGTKEYTLNAKAVVDPLNVVTINGNGATIKVGAEGQFEIQNGIVLDNVVIDAADATLNLIEMATTPADDLKIKSEKYGQPATYYTAEEAAAFNEQWAQEIEEGDETAKHEGDLKTAATVGFKYEGASQDVPESEKIAILNSTIKSLPQALIAGNTAKWALCELDIENSLINFNTTTIAGGNSNQAAIAVGSIKNITIKNNTVWNTGFSNNSFFIRYTNASNAQPAKVWGTGAKCLYVLEANTFVNALGSKDFGNNIVSNASQVDVELTNNVFFDVFRVKNKFVGNNNFDKTVTPTVNIFDASGAFALANDESNVGTILTAGASGITLPTAETGFELTALVNNFKLADDYKTFGDQRWNDETLTAINSVVENTADVKVRKAIVNGKIVIVKNGATYNVAGQIVK